ncbi:MAG: hypothetical protein H6861_01915 [Rhodospirillales bacterium]|nr:hypothetical protein [Rhodospirillales bacterium]
MSDKTADKEPNDNNPVDSRKELLDENKGGHQRSGMMLMLKASVKCLEDAGIRKAWLAAIKEFAGATHWVVNMFNIEENYLRTQKVLGIPLKAHEGEHHEDDYIAALQKIGGKEAVRQLATTIAQYYPEKAIAALETMDEENTPEAIFLSGQVDFEAGLGQHNADAFSAMARLHKSAKAGEFKNITPESIQNFTRKLVKSLLDAPALLKALDGCRPHPSKTLYSSFDIDDCEKPPVSDELISSFRKALKAVDDQKILPRKVSRIFGDIVTHYKRTKASENNLQQRVTSLEL